MEIRYDRSFAAGPYAEVVVIEGNTEVRSGLLDREERRELARQFRDVADDLSDEEK